MEVIMSAAPVWTFTKRRGRVFASTRARSSASRGKALGNNDCGAPGTRRLVAASGMHARGDGSDRVYWKPVWHVLEGEFELILANPGHIRNVPGRKSDVNDATWIAAASAAVLPPFETNRTILTGS